MTALTPVKQNTMSKMNIVLLEVTTDKVLARGPFTNEQALTALLRFMEEQPLKYVSAAPRWWVANLETGEITKPRIKLEL
jgi:hypothetical protein